MARGLGGQHVIYVLWPHFFLWVPIKKQLPVDPSIEIARNGHRYEGDHGNQRMRT
jgi:hypothetical protein